MIPLGNIWVWRKGSGLLQIGAELIQILHVDKIAFGFKCLQQLDLVIIDVFSIGGKACCRKNALAFIQSGHDGTSSPMGDQKIRFGKIICELFPVNIINDLHPVAFIFCKTSLNNDLFLDDAFFNGVFHRIQQSCKGFIICAKCYKYHQNINPPYTAFGYISSMLSH